MGVHRFTELKFWQKSRQWSKRVYQLTKRNGFSNDRRLVAQINDSSASVTANIAEGFGRGTQGEFVTVLGYSIGSLNETQSHLCTALDRNHITREEFAKEFQEGTEIRKMIVAFVRSMTKRGSGVKHMVPVKSWTDEVWERYEKITGKPRPEWITNKTFPKS